MTSDITWALEPGIHLVHKEVGGSSFDVVRGFKHEAFEDGQKKLALGHGGTLDPFAEGLLLVLAGQATRLMELMHPLPKTYLARLVWGVETDTCDHLGLVVAQGPTPTPERLMRLTTVPPASVMTSAPRRTPICLGAKATVMVHWSGYGRTPVQPLSETRVKSLSAMPSVTTVTEAMSAPPGVVEKVSCLVVD